MLTRGFIPACGGAGDNAAGLKDSVGEPWFVSRQATAVAFVLVAEGFSPAAAATKPA